MKNLLLIILGIVLFSGTAFSQSYETDKESQEAMSKLAFIEGNWKGEGWMMRQDGKKHPFTQTEKISFKLDGTALLVEGLGKEGEKIIHNALAVITYDKTKGHYNFNSRLANGMGGNFKAELIDNKLHWYPNENIKYIISLNEKGQWHEVGKIKRGEEWFQFFEMTLDKQ